jgi:hypothetical protein
MMRAVLFVCAASACWTSEPPHVTPPPEPAPAAVTRRPPPPPPVTDTECPNDLAQGQPCTATAETRCHVVRTSYLCEVFTCVDHKWSASRDTCDP